MNKEEKIRQYRDFISSEKFTKDSYGVLMVFRENTHRMINLAELHVIVLKRVESGDIRHNFPEPIILRIKQLILVDVLSKIMTMIENLLVLFDTFSRYSKGKIPSRMIRYRQPSVDGFIERFQSDKVNLWKLAGFPNLTFLRRNCGLDMNEMLLIREILKDSRQHVRQEIARIINFYQSNRTVYGKFKHGLLFQSGFSPENLSPTAPEDLSLFSLLTDNQICQKEFALKTSFHQKKSIGLTFTPYFPVRT